MVLLCFGLGFFGCFFFPVFVCSLFFLINLLTWNKLKNANKYSLQFYFSKLYFPDTQTYQYKIFQTLAMNWKTQNTFILFYHILRVIILSKGCLERNMWRLHGRAYGSSFDCRYVLTTTETLDHEIIIRRERIKVPLQAWNYA